MKKSNSNSGFTLLELMITITIIGILAASVTYSISDFVKEKRSEQHVISLWSELSTYRSRAIKDDCPYIVDFDIVSGKNYTVYKNNVGNYSIATTVEAGETEPSSTVVSSGFFSVSGDIEFGFPDGYDFSASVGGYTAAPGRVIYDEWWASSGDNPTKLSAGGTNRANGIVFKHDEIGTITDGVIFIKNTALPKRGYAIIKAPNTHTLKLFKWDGSRWYEM